MLGIFLFIAVFAICIVNPRSKADVWISSILIPLGFSVLYVLAWMVMYSGQNVSSEYLLVRPIRVGDVLVRCIGSSIVSSICIYVHLKRKLVNLGRYLFPKTILILSILIAVVSSIVALSSIAVYGSGNSFGFWACVVVYIILSPILIWIRRCQRSGGILYHNSDVSMKEVQSSKIRRNKIDNEHVKYAPVEMVGDKGDPKKPAKRWFVPFIGFLFFVASTVVCVWCFYQIYDVGKYIEKKNFHWKWDDEMLTFVLPAIGCVALCTYIASVRFGIRSSIDEKIKEMDCDIRIAELERENEFLKHYFRD